jgi:hypothetical protein
VDVDTLVRNWWVVLLRGVAGIIFGLLTFFAPGISLVALVLVFGAYAFADGILAIISAIRRRGESDRWWVLLLERIGGGRRGRHNAPLDRHHRACAALCDRRLGARNRWRQSRPIPATTRP